MVLNLDSFIAEVDFSYGPKTQSKKNTSSVKIKVLVYDMDIVR